MLQQAGYIFIVYYYPFGMVTPGRSFSAGDGYRFGFNGQEQVDEIYGNGNLNTAEFWEYDTRIGRRWNLDPVVDFSISQYATLGNNPISNIDINGDAWGSSAKRQAKEAAKATGGRAYKAKSQIKGKDNSGVWHVDVKGTPYGDLMKQRALENGAISGQTLVFKPGENKSEFLREELGVEYWDAALADESGWEWVKTKLSAGDSWVHSEDGETFGRNVANMNPGIAASNIVSGIASGSDIYGLEMNSWDYVNNGLALIPGEALVGQEVSVILRVGKFTGKVLTAAQLAKRLGVTIEFYHKSIKPEMKRQFAKEAKELNTTNPDFTPDKSGNIVVVNPVTKESITTNISIDSFKEW